jgi:hypothetical protein
MVFNCMTGVCEPHSIPATSVLHQLAVEQLVELSEAGFASPANTSSSICTTTGWHTLVGKRLVPATVVQFVRDEAFAHEQSTRDTPVAEVYIMMRNGMRAQHARVRLKDPFSQLSNCVNLYRPLLGYP